jgi:hypothetical protein
MTSPSPSEPTETPRNRLEFCCELCQCTCIAPDAYRADLVRGPVYICARCHNQLQWVRADLNAPSPELQRTGEAKDREEFLMTIAETVGRKYEDKPNRDNCGPWYISACLEALQLLSTHYEAREAQVRARLSVTERELDKFMSAHAELMLKCHETKEGN